MVLNLFPKKDSSDDAEPDFTNDDTVASNEDAPRTQSRRRTRRPRTASAEPTSSTRTRASDDEAEKPLTRRPSAGSTRTSDKSAEAADDETPRPTRRAPSRAKQQDNDFGALLSAIEKQSDQLARLIELQEAAVHRTSSSVQPARVGIFVDAANVELAADRVKKKIDWTMVVELLTKDRRLIRAVSYSPTHDDPGVSMETQRFVEPFLDSGFKIVTKPLKRFADGTIKANVDIELALDIMSMCDRLDVVCLVSGDGDFQHLVEVVQSRGVRVEVVGYGGSVAGALRRAADAYIDIETVFGGNSTRRGRRN